MTSVGDPGFLLSYGTNVHPGESIAEIIRDLRQVALPLKARLSPNAPFPLPLRLGRRAWGDWESSEAARADLRSFLGQSGFQPYTVNAFPCGEFQAPVVKEKVYEPDWRQAERSDYTLGVARILADLLPQAEGHGTISTVPLGFWPQEEERAREDSARALRALALRLADLEGETGKRISLALEPEPLCALSTLTEGVRFCEEVLFAGVPSSEEAVLRRHLGLCLDFCHQAVMFESAREGLLAAERAGVSVFKAQISAALEVARPPLPREPWTSLETFAEPRFLHQVAGADGNGKRAETWLDLSELKSRPPSSDIATLRCHFHVPIHWETTGQVRTTRACLEEIRDPVVRRRLPRHLEVETYTYSVLPGGMQVARLPDIIAEELGFATSLLLAGSAAADGRERHFD